jgi:hypothetical protein
METIEPNEPNYYDQKPVTIELTVEEHELLKNTIIHAMDSVDLLGICLYDLPEDSEIRKRYEALESLSDRIRVLWSNRFSNPPYQN